MGDKPKALVSKWHCCWWSPAKAKDITSWPINFYVSVVGKKTCSKENFIPRDDTKWSEGGSHNREATRVFSSFYHSEDGTLLTCYQAKKSKMCYVLSTRHEFGTICQEDRKQKSNTILCYNKTKTTVDILDQMAHASGVRRWLWICSSMLLIWPP